MREEEGKKEVTDDGRVSPELRDHGPWLRSSSKTLPPAAWRCEVVEAGALTGAEGSVGLDQGERARPSRRHRVMHRACVASSRMVRRVRGQGCERAPSAWRAARGELAASRQCLHGVSPGTT